MNTLSLCLIRHPLLIVPIIRNSSDDIRYLGTRVIVYSQYLNGEKEKNNNNPDGNKLIKCTFSLKKTKKKTQKRKHK